MVIVGSSKPYTTFDGICKIGNIISTSQKYNSDILLEYFKNITDLTPGVFNEWLPYQQTLSI